MQNEAQYLLGKFKWGPTFINLNQELLNGYCSQCTDSQSVVSFQNQWLEKAESEKRNHRKRNRRYDHNEDEMESTDCSDDVDDEKSEQSLKEFQNLQIEDNQS